MAKKKTDAVKLLDMGLIDEPEGRIRMEIDQVELLVLADSIDALGQLQPILVRPVGERYEIVYGHRRFLAHQRLGKTRILTTIRELDDIEVALMRATENIARLDISPLEEAAVYHELRGKCGLTLEQIAKKMGKSRGIIKRRLDLLTMPTQIQKAVHEKKISHTVAETLWQLGDEGAIDYYLGFAIEHGATLAVVKQWCKDHKDSVRRSQRENAPGGGLQSPFENQPVYVACDTCRGAMEIGEETAFRCCPACTEAIIEVTKRVHSN